ncbi:MAG: OB-fold nucleic acid binding domain-containing protein, partial [Lysobacterales bacterium]
FYQPAQLVQDARRHDVRVLPVDVRYSEWDCTLEKGALRLGLRMVKGMRQDTTRRLHEARTQRLFQNIQDLAMRAALDQHDLAVLAEAAALRGLAGHRHRARWEVAAVERNRNWSQSKNHDFYSDPNFISSTKRYSDPDFVSIRPPSEPDDTRADYASLGLSLGRHPIALLRSQLRRRRAKTATELHALPHGSRVRACGLVTMRQRPMTASGTIFLTLEDETGHVNVVIWPRLWDKQRAEILGATVLAVDGVMETDGEVHHLIANRVHDFSALMEGLSTKSRDFC